VIHRTPADYRPGGALRAASTLLCLAALVPLAGCSNSPYPAGQTAENILYRAMSDDPKSLDPTYSYVVTEARVIDIIYPCFFRYHYLKRDPNVLELNLGAEMPKRVPYAARVQGKDGKVQAVRGEEWTFRMKKGIRFQDDSCFPDGKGREVTAADFIYSFRRMADPTVECPVLSYFADKIEGFQEYIDANEKRGRADFSAPVSGLQLDPADPYTFRLRLTQPYPQLKYLMTMHFTSPIPHEAVEKYGKEFPRHPVGCGPYMMRPQDWVPKKRITLVANPNRPDERYPMDGMPEDEADGLLADAGKPLPRADKIVFTIVREGVTVWNLFLQGYLDNFTVTQESFQKAMSRQGQLSDDMKRQGVRLLKSSDPNIRYFGFNMDDPVVGGYAPKKKKLRQAISLAFDANAFIDLQSQGQGTPGQWIVPPGIYGYDPAYRNPYRQYDAKLARAKQLLAEAGYPNGIDPESGNRLTIYYDNAYDDAAGRQIVGLVVKQVEALGINLEPRTSRFIIWQDRIDHGQFQFMDYGWLADYPDPENFVFLLYGPNKRPGPNSANYNNPEYNRLFEQMRSMDDSPARIEIMNRMRDIAAEDCPWIFLQHDQDLYLSHAWNHNLKPHPVSNEGLKYQGVDGPLRARLQAQWNRPNYWPSLAALALLVFGSLPAASAIRRHRSRHVRKGGAADEPEATGGSR
jgi:oligopeptide transport system substrate-binding protein